jgi:hypothetical protein
MSRNEDQKHLISGFNWGVGSRDNGGGAAIFRKRLVMRASVAVMRW